MENRGPEDLRLSAVIGFKANVVDGLFLLEDRILVFPLGCSLVLRDVVSKEQHFLNGHDNEITCIVPSPKGNLLASGQKTFMGFNADVIIWDWRKRKEVFRFSLHKVQIQSIAFSANEKFLATLGGQDDNALVVWNLHTGDAVCGTPAHSEISRSVKFYNTKNDWLVTAGNYYIKCWRLDEENKKLTPQNINCGQLRRVVTSLLLDERDEYLYCGTETGDILVIFLGSFVYKMAFPKKLLGLGISCLSILPGNVLLVGSGDGMICKFDVNSLKSIGKCEVSGGVTSLAATSDARHFFCGTSLANIYWIELNSLTPELRNTCHSSKINSIVFPPNYSEVFATSGMSEIRIWQLKTKQELLRIQVPHVDCTTLDFTRDGKLIVSGWSDGKIRAFLPQSGRLYYVINDAHTNGVTSLKSTSDCAKLISGGQSGELRVWRTSSTQHLESSLKEHRTTIHDIQLKQDDTQCVSASADGSCIIWDLTTKTRALCLFVSTVFRSVVYHPDETQLLTCGSDRKITFWDTYDGEAIRVLEGSDEAELTSLSMSKSGSHFVSGGVDRVIRVWEYELGLCELRGVGHSGTVNSVTFSPCQKQVLSCGDDGAIFIWTLPDETCDKCHDTARLE